MLLGLGRAGVEARLNTALGPQDTVEAAGIAERAPAEGRPNRSDKSTTDLADRKLLPVVGFLYL